MIFSIFGSRKKDGAAARRQDESRDQNPAEVQREIARQTAEKIDRIESEMELGSSRGTGSRPAAAAPVAASPAAAASAAAVPAGQGGSAGPVSGAGTADPYSEPHYQSATGAQTDVHLLHAARDEGLNTEMVLGGVPLTHSVEVTASALLPVFEETAIMFANNQADAAVAILRQAIKDDSLGEHVRQGWAMLFELFEATGQRADFEALGLEYASRFETSPPAWSEDVAPRAPEQAASLSASVIAFPDRLTREHAARQLDQIARAVVRNRPADVDFSRVRSVEAEAAHTVQKLLVDARRQERKLTLSGIESLRAALQPCVETGRRDESDGCWLLLLESLRLLREQQAFEDTAIDYCVTYEVSPPSWEVMPRSIQVQGGVQSTVMGTADTESAQGAGDDGSLVRLEGEIVQSEAAFAQIRQFAKLHNHVVVDCRRLRRIDFVSAGDLYNEIAQLRSSGKTVEFRAVSHLIGCLLVVMSVHEQAELKVRVMA